MNPQVPILLDSPISCRANAPKWNEEKNACHAGKFWEFTYKIYPATLANAEIVNEFARDPPKESLGPDIFSHYNRKNSGMTSVFSLMRLPYIS